MFFLLRWAVTITIAYNCEISVLSGLHFASDGYFSLNKKIGATVQDTFLGHFLRPAVNQTKKLQL